MKGIVMAVGLLALSMGVSLGLMFYVSFESLKLDTDTALKQALEETMVALDTLDPSLRQQQALSLFVSNFSLRKKKAVSYKIDLMGFIADPLALRIRISATDTASLFDLQLTAEETMIEVQE